MYFCALLHGHVRVPVWHTNLCSPFILSNETGICEMELTFQKLWLSYLPLIPQVLWPTSIEYETVSKFWESHVPKSLISFCCSGQAHRRNYAIKPRFNSTHCFGILTTHYFSGESNEKRFWDHHILSTFCWVNVKRC